jgi:hypothetical protein
MCLRIFGIFNLIWVFQGFFNRPLLDAAELHSVLRVIGEDQVMR